MVPGGKPQREGRGQVPYPKLLLSGAKFSRRSFMMRARLWQEGTPYRTHESSAFTLVVSQLVWDLEPERKAQQLQCELKPIDHRVGVI